MASLLDISDDASDLGAPLEDAKCEDDEREEPSGGEEGIEEGSPLFLPESHGPETTN